MNWRKLVLPGIVLLLAAGLYTFRFAIVFFAMTPKVGFDPAQTPPAPDYADLKFWAMHPGKSDQKATPGSLQIFWVHPTSYRSPLHWNESLGDEAATERFSWSRVGQVSLFNDCCLIFAPHYRQATLASYWKHEGGFQARELAYTDVLRAFDHFIAQENQGQPFIIAGHSQGSEHGLRLLRDRVVGTPLQERLVAAYLVGMPLVKSYLEQNKPPIPICEKPEDTGCVIAWSTFRSGSDPQKFLKQAVWHDESGYHSVSGDIVCVNPVSWTSGNQETTLDQHHGAHLKRNSGLKIKARCEQGVVFVDNVDAYVDVSLGGNYHLDDYSLFYYDIQSNVKIRSDAYNASHKRL